MNDHGKLIELERPPVIETAVLVRLVLPSDGEDEVQESLDEMRRLAWTAGAEVACTIVQRRPKPCPATLIGKGKLEEVRAACEEVEADVVLADSDLTPAQGAKLEAVLGVKVVDRTQLILDIFAQHAHTNEGKHQVELAQLDYILPRLAGRGAVMRQKGGIGLRGPGEQKLEEDRRVIRRRIDRLRADIEAIRKQRRIQRKRRKESAARGVALVGYTNAGKSSLLNALTGADVLVEDKLFATLDPRARRCKLPSQREVVFSDTVGFIRKLPHGLVAAFRATLEEVNDADLILLVADAAHPATEDHVNAVYEVLREIDAFDKPVLNVFNKIDIADPGRVRELDRALGHGVGVSALTGEGIEDLAQAVDAQLAGQSSRVMLRIPQSKAGLVARLHQVGRVLEESYEDNAILVNVELDHAIESQFREFIACR